MLSHLFAALGIVQLALTVYAGYLAVKSLPLGEKRPQHLPVFVVLGLFGTALTILTDVQTNKSEEQAKEAQNRLNQKLEYQSGQLATIAGMLKVNSTDPAAIAAALAQALHPPGKLPCLNPAHFTATQRQSPIGYETLIRISNPTGMKLGTTFQFFFTTRVVSIQSPDVKPSYSSSGSDIATFTVGSEVPKGKPFTILAGGSLVPAQVKCVDRFDPKP